MPFHAGDDRSAKSQIPRIASQGAERENLLNSPQKSQKNLKSQFPHFLYFMTFEFSRQKYNLILAQKFKPQKTFEFSRPKNNLILCSFSAKIQILHFTTFAKC